MNDFYFYCSFVDEYDPTIGKQSLPCLRVWILLVYCCHDLGFSCVMDSLLSQTFFFSDHGFRRILIANEADCTHGAWDNFYFAWFWSDEERSTKLNLVSHVINTSLSFTEVVYEIPCALGCRAYLLLLQGQLSLYFPLFISVMGTCLLRGVGTHGWVVKFASH